MKTRFTNICQLIVAGAAFCFALLAPAARAAVGVESFNLTNRLVAGETSATGNPTNAAGVVTGGPINVENVTSVEIIVQGSNTLGGVTNVGVVSPGTSNYVYVGLCRADPDSTSLSWESVQPFWSAKFPVAGTTNVTYYTNVTVNNARYIGICASSNTCSSGTFTNGAGGGQIVRVVKKIVPTVFP